MKQTSFNGNDANSSLMTKEQEILKEDFGEHRDVIIDGMQVENIHELQNIEDTQVLANHDCSLAETIWRGPHLQNVRRDLYYKHGCDHLIHNTCHLKKKRVLISQLHQKVECYSSLNIIRGIIILLFYPLSLFYAFNDNEYYFYQWCIYSFRF